MTNFSVQPTNHDAILDNGGGIHGALITQFDLMIRARYPIIYIVLV
jgi:hypothetical protein